MTPAVYLKVEEAAGKVVLGAWLRQLSRESHARFPTAKEKYGYPVFKISVSCSAILLLYC